MKRFLPLLFLLMLPAVGCDSSDSSSTSASTEAEDPNKHITEERFQAVAKIFEDQGARVERDPQATDTVRIYVSSSVAAGLSDSQAKTMASDARSKLASEAIVYIKNEAGDTLGKSTPW